MKTSWIVIVSAVLGIVLGVATSWARLERDAEPDPLLAAALAQTSTVEAPAGSGPKVVVEVDEYDFGPVAALKSVEHAFRFENAGDAPLKLAGGGTTCAKCTFSSVPSDPIPPGQSADVVVAYNAADVPADFRQTATVLTGDPLRPRVDLTVSGKIVVPVGVQPKDVVFSRLSAAEPHTATVKVVAFLDPDFKIESFKLTDDETAKFYDVAIEPLSDTELETVGGKRGDRVSITVKPGMPLGPLRQSLVLHTNVAEPKDLTIPIAGSIESDVSIAGPNFDRSRGLLAMATVDRQGAERKLLVLVRGENRHSIKVSVGSSTPPLEATLGEPTDLNADTVQIPLKIKIPAGSPPANHLQNYGKILLETSHPEAQQLRIWVQFAVED
jgi:uncharacterized protein DUF1573